MSESTTLNTGRTTTSGPISSTNPNLALNREDIARISGAADGANVDGAARVLLARQDQVQTTGDAAPVKGAFRPLPYAEVLKAKNYDPKLDGTTTIRGSPEIDAYVNGLVRRDAMRAKRDDAERSLAIYRDEKGALQSVDVTSGASRQNGSTTETTVDLGLMPPGTSDRLVAIAHSHPRDSNAKHSVGVGDDGVLNMWGVPNYVTWGDGSGNRLYALERDNGQFQYRQVSGPQIDRLSGAEGLGRFDPKKQTERFLRQFQLRARPPQADQ